MSKRLLAVFTALVLSTAAVAACDDNAQDHAEEAAEEARSGDKENAAESRQDAREDLAQGDTTEGIN